MKVSADVYFPEYSSSDFIRPKRMYYAPSS